MKGMKMLARFGFTLLLLSFALCCQKGNIFSSGNNNNNNGNGNQDTTQSSPVGTPTGPSVKAFISSAGGKIATSDGRIELTIPAGALPNGDTISILNISNLSESGIGDAYRFLPNGLKFATPVTMTIHYADSDIVGSLPGLLGIAYQDSAGYWKGIQPATVDSASKTVSVKTNHFTDYMAFLYMKIEPVAGAMSTPGNELPVNATEVFKVLNASPSNVAIHLGFSRSALVDPVGAQFKVNNIAGGNPSVGTAADASPGNSTIPGIGDIVACLFQAPAKVPSPDVVMLSTKISYISQAVPDGPPPTYQEVILYYPVRIVAPKVYRLDIVDWQSLATGNIKYNDSASILIHVGPEQINTYTVSGDSILNYSPGASPSAASGSDGCSYTWIPEPVGTVNITAASVNYSNWGSGNYFVIVNWTQANGNLPWFTVQCPGAGTTETHKEPQIPSNGQFPMILNTQRTSYDTLLTGTADQTHVRITLVPQ